MLFQDEQALIVECKYSADASTVARDGYHQASAYALEAKSLVEDVISVVVGPEEVVVGPGFVETIAGRIGVIPPTAIPVVVAELAAT